MISDEVYAHMSFGNKPFVPMGVFGSIAPVLTLGSLSKKWCVPGWRLGWILTTDPDGILEKHGVCSNSLFFLPSIFMFEDLMMPMLISFYVEVEIFLQLRRITSIHFFGYHTFFLSRLWRA